MEVTKFGEIQLECKSAGWFPQPVIQWINSQGKTIPSVSQTHSQDKRGLFQVTASLLLRNPSENVTCSIWNEVLNQKKEEQLSVAGERKTALYLTWNLGRLAPHSTCFVPGFVPSITTTAALVLESNFPLFSLLPFLSSLNFLVLILLTTPVKLSPFH